MRYLWCLLLLIGCSSPRGIHIVDPGTLKFHAGQKVTTNIGFYSDCKGTIVNHAKYAEDNGPLMYAVSFNCPNVGKLEEVYISEESLVNK